MSENDDQHKSVAAPVPQSDSVGESEQKSVRPEMMQRLEVGVTLLDAPNDSVIYPVVKRLMDMGVSGVLILVLAPILILVSLWLLVVNKAQIVRSEQKIGRHGRAFSEYTFFKGFRFLRELPILMNILKGDMSFIGPRAVGVQEVDAKWTDERLISRRTKVRPGLICDWWIRRKGSLDYLDELTLDAAYADGYSLKKDLGIVLRSLPGLAISIIWGNDPPKFLDAISILGVRIDNLSMQRAIEAIEAMLDSKETKQVSFINPQNINVTFQQPEYKAVLANSDLILADGFGTKLAGKILKRPLRQNLCGTDLFPRLCEALSQSGKSIYLLGAAPGAAEQVAEWVRAQYPDLTIKGSAHGYFTESDEPEWVRSIAESNADVLVVSMGTPTQELFIHKHLQSLNVGVAIGFGGLFDYFAGRIPRAPQWVREIGMEWMYRLIQEPRRMWRRYLIGNGVFIGRVLYEKCRPAKFALDSGADDLASARGKSEN